MTTRGSGTDLRVLSNGWCMLRVTTPVAMTPSAWRGEATTRAPNRSASYTEEKAPPISSSQPLQEPASTCRSCSEPVTPVGGATLASGGSSAGSTMRPTRRIVLIQLIGPVPWLCSCALRRGTRVWLPHTSAVRQLLILAVGLQIPQQIHLVGEQPGEHLAGKQQQLGHVFGGDRVDHVVPLLAGHHHAGPAQDGELLGQVRGLEPELGHQLANRVLTLGQQLQDSNSCRVSQRLEELGLQLVDRFRHLVLPLQFGRLSPGRNSQTISHTSISCHYW